MPKTSSNFAPRALQIIFALFKDFDKDKWKEYFNLDLAKGALFNIETDQVLDFAIELLKELKF